MNYSKIDKCECANGLGYGVSLFVQGCHHHCKNCFNPETWDFDGGLEWTPETETNFIQYINKPYITRVSFLGGEPLESKNLGCLYRIISKIKEVYPSKKIWLWTGYTLEEISNDIMKRTLTKMCDYLIDNRYDDSKRDLTLAFRGSSNQTIWENQKGIWVECKLD